MVMIMMASRTRLSTRGLPPQVVVGREAVVSISSLGKATVGDPVDVACTVEEEVNMIMLGVNMVRFPNLYF